MLTAGTCTLQANQPGSIDYNAAPGGGAELHHQRRGAERSDAHRGHPSNGAATLSFNPPANYGGTPITSYTATCNPGASPQRRRIADRRRRPRQRNAVHVFGHRDERRGHERRVEYARRARHRRGDSAVITSPASTTFT
jgi:hypothetical protein